MHSPKCRYVQKIQIHDSSDTTLASLSSPNTAKTAYHADPGTIVTLDLSSRWPIVLASIRSLFRISLIQNSTMKQHCSVPLHQVNHPTTKALCIFVFRIVSNLPFKASVHKSIVWRFNIIVKDIRPLPLFASHKLYKQTAKLPHISTQHHSDLHTLTTFFLRST